MKRRAPFTLHRVFFFIFCLLALGTPRAWSAQKEALSPAEASGGAAQSESGSEIGSENRAPAARQKGILRRTEQNIPGESFSETRLQKATRLHPTISGQPGLFRLRSATSLPEEALSFGAGLEFYSVANGPPIGGTSVGADTIAESLFIAYAPVENLTLSAQRRNSSTTYSLLGAPSTLVSSLGDITFGAAYSFWVNEDLAIAPYGQMVVASNFNNLTPSGTTVSFGLGASASYHLQTALELPIIGHASILYNAPNIRDPGPGSLQPETFFKFSRFHTVTVGVGAEYQLENFSPFLEWRAVSHLNSGLGSANPSWFTLGGRFTPLSNKSLALLAGVDIATSQGLTPGVPYTPPAQAVALLSYTFGLTSTERTHYYQATEVRIVNRKLVINRSIRFQVGKAILEPSSYSLLDQIADVVQKNGVEKLLVVGHTDSSHTEDYNLSLSVNRARAVKSYLEKKGIAADRLLAQGYGKRRPKASNLTEEGRAKNRRVEFFILQ